MRQLKVKKIIRKDETKNLDSKNKNKINSNNPRLNRFMSKEKYIQLNEETSMNKKGKKIQNRKKAITSKRQDKFYNKKVYSMNAKDKCIRRKNFRKKKSLGGFIVRLMKKKDDENKKKMEKLKSDIESKFCEIINAQNEKIAAQDQKINEQKDEIIEANKKIALLSEIQNQSDILSNKMNKYTMKLGTGFNSLYNSCKVLYIRKICDFILEGLINKYQNSLALTRYNFQNEAGTIFPLIVFKNDIHKMSKYYLSLLIDYLMETKQNCSAIVHMNIINDKALLPIMKEVFFILLNKSQTNSNEFTLDIEDMTGVVLGNNQMDEELTDLEEKNEEEFEEEEGNKIGRAHV